MFLANYTFQENSVSPLLDEGPDVKDVIEFDRSLNPASASHSAYICKYMFLKKLITFCVYVPFRKLFLESR